MKKPITLFVLFLAVQAFSHEGHNDAPGMLRANHGGVVKQGKGLNLEYVISGNEVKLYPQNHKGVDLKTTEVKVSATLTPPRGKAQKINFTPKNGVYATQIDFKGAHRVTLDVTTDYKGKTDRFKIQVEQP